MLRSTMLAVLLLLGLLWSMTVMVAAKNIVVPLQSAGASVDQAGLAATTAVTPTGVITVTTTEDEVNNDGDCSLREAIQAATLVSAVDACPAASGRDTIYIPAGLYQLTLGQLELSGTVTLQGSITDTTILDGNHQDRVVYIYYGAKVTLRHLDIRNGERINSLSDDGTYLGEGGGIDNYGTAWIAFSTIHNNHATFAGSFPYAEGGASGGGIFNQGALTVTSSTITGNSAGDGVLNGHSGFIYCGAIGDGGGIANFGILLLENTTVTDNKPGAPGECPSSPQLVTSKAGGVYSAQPATAKIKNSIIVGNGVNDCGGLVTSLGNNVVQAIDGCTINEEVTDRYWAAHLGPLGDNGGPTLTQALEKQSPAIDAGDCTDSTGLTVTVDQRGEPRPQGDGCDIGAYESSFTATFTIRQTSLPVIASLPCADTLTSCNLTRNPSLDQAPSWSPDGSRIAFAKSRTADGEDGIYVMNADGTMPIKVTDSGSQPIWSPDGTKIAVLANLGTNIEIFVVDTDGNHLTNITNMPTTNESLAVWSPDGSKILFESGDANSCCASNLYVMNADGSQKRLLATPGQLSLFPWSPDGSRIIYGDSSIHILSLDGSNPITLTTGAQPAGVFPAWSPDGSKIAFTCFLSATNGQSDLCTMNSDGSQVTTLVTDGHVAFDPPIWSSDSSKLLFLHKNDPQGGVGELAIINASGGGITQVTSTLQGFFVASPAWSPDGRKIAYVHGQFINESVASTEIFVVGIGE